MEHILKYLLYSTYYIYYITYYIYRGYFNIAMFFNEIDVSEAKLFLFAY